MLWEKLVNNKTIYLLVFLSLAGWSIFAYITMMELIEQQKVYAKIINLSGKQRMLSQRTALMTTRVFLENETELVSHRDELLQTMKEEYQFIVTNLTSLKIKDIYFNPPYALDKRVKNYFTLLEKSPSKDLQSYVDQVQAESSALLPILDRAVYAFENEANNITATLKERETFIVVGTLLTLLFESLFIVFPILRKSEKREQIIEKEREKFKIFMDLSSDCIHILDCDGNVVECSQSFAKALGYSYEEVLQMNVADWDVFIPQEKLIPMLHGLIKSPMTFETKQRCKNGDIIDVQISTRGIKIDDQHYLYASSRDITEQKHEYDERMKEKAKLEAITDNSHDAIVMMGPDGEITFWNPAAQEIFGYKAEEVIGKNLHELLSPERYIGDFKEAFKEFKHTGKGNVVGRQLDVEGIHKDGHEVSIDITLDAIKVDEKWNAIGLIRDITERKIAEQIILKQSVTDELTQLHNRKAFNERMEEMIAEAKRFNTPFSMLILDIDHFKSVNDNYGHQVGDDVLVAVSKKLQANARKTDYVFRFGGEEFVILSAGTELEHAVVFAEKIRSSIQNNVTLIEGKEITISIGVAEFSEGDDHDTLLKRADDNLYKAKESGRNRVIADH